MPMTKAQRAEVSRRNGSFSRGPVSETGKRASRMNALTHGMRAEEVALPHEDPQAVEDLKQKGCKTLALDVTDEASMRAAVDQVVGEEGAVGALVNNAGYSQSGALESVPMDQLRRQFETNVFGLLRMCQLVLPGMREQRDGRIVNVSSMGGRLTFPGGGAYHATKYAVEALSDVLRFEVSGFGIHVVLIEPGLIRTQFGEAAVSSIGEIEQDGPYAKFNAAVAATTAGAYHGPLSPPGGRPRGRGPHDREGLDQEQAKGSLSGHRVGSAHARPARDPARPRLGRDGGHDLPQARPLISAGWRRTRAAGRLTRRRAGRPPPRGDG